MKMRRIEAMINCPTFKNHYSLIRANKQKISRSARPIEKSIFEEEISEITLKLLQCESYDPQSQDCRQCRSYAASKSKSVSSNTTAGTIV